MKLNQYQSLSERLGAGFPAFVFGRVFRHRKGCWPGKSGEPACQDTRTTSAFTLVEVAIALAVIGFALVAIIGILPAGLNVQKENREETIINQEVSIWMDAIRQGAEGMDYLVDYVDLITVTKAYFDAAGNPSFTALQYFTPYESRPAGYELTNGASIIGLISTPQFRPDPNVAGGFISNRVDIYVRAISGSATEKMPQDNQTVREGAFGYRLTASVMPFYAVSDQWYDYYEFLQVAGQGAGAGNDPELAYARRMAANLHDVRLRFRWPLRPPFDARVQPEQVPTNVGPGRLTFRTSLSGSATNEFTGDGVVYSWLQPGRFKAKGGIGP